MYKVAHFIEEDREKLLDFIQAHPFAMLIGVHQDMPEATQIPLQLKLAGNTIRLIGHVMKNTEHYRAFVANENVLVLFHGAHAYVSAAVYEQPESASTWNYQSVQAKGKIRLLDEQETRMAIKSLTDQYETADSPAAFSRLSEQYIDQHLKAIVGVEITVEKLTGVFKLSQNHSQLNRQNIIEHLSQSKDVQAQQVAMQMKEIFVAPKRSNE